jgi:hypothetical protein
MADTLFYVVSVGLVVMAAITVWVVTTPGTHLFLG